MSYFGTIHKNPSIYLVDGVVRDDTIQDIAYQIEASFELVGDLIGNIHGSGLETVPASRFVNSISTAIGDLSKVSQDEPFGVRFDSYIQNYTNDGSRKDYILDLIPVDGNTIAINAPDDSGVIWNHRSSLVDLVSVGDFNVSGRVITFYTPPTNQFSVRYDGNYPEFSSVNSGYMPNVYPDPGLISSGIVQRPRLERRPSGRLRVEMTKTNYNSQQKAFGANLELEFNPMIEQYLSPIGATECPSELASAWIKSGSGFKRLESSGIFLIDSTTFEIDTDEEVDPLHDVIVLSISNTSLSDMVRDLYTFVRSHNHDKQDITASIDHGKLVNLIPASNNPDIIYGGSALKGNDHPQYLHREGYTDGDSGSYNNALLGDLLISSTNSASLYNNILSDSNRLVFGSTTEGVSLKYRATEEDLHVYSSKNGVTIQTPTGSGKESNALILNGHQFFDYGGALSIAPAGGLLRITNEDGVTFADLAANSIASNSLDSANIGVTIGGKFKIGEIEFTDSLGTVIAAGPDLLRITNRTWLDNFSGNMTVDEDSHIYFGTTSSYFANKSGISQGQYYSISPLAFTNTGRDTGFSIEHANKEYFNMYSASPNGSISTPSDHDMYAEAGEGGFYYLMSTKTEQVEGTTTYTWQSTEEGKTRVDDLRNWPKAPIHAGHSTFSSLQVNTSSVDERRGLSFGGFNHMYVTGSGTACPSGWMVLESQNGVVIVDSSTDPVDCSSLSYGDLTSGDIQAFGSIIAEDDISAGGDITANEKITGKYVEVERDLEVNGESRLVGDATFEGLALHLADAQFNTNVTVKGSVDIANSLQVGNFRSKGISVFEEITRFEANTTIQQDLYVEGTTRLSGRVTAEGRIDASEISAGPITASNFSASEVIYANGGIEARSDINISGNLSVSNIATIQTNLIVNDTVFADKISATGSISTSKDLDVEGEATIRGDTTVGGNGGKFTALGDTALNGTRTSISGRLDMYGDSAFYGDVVVNANALFESTVEIKGSTLVGSDLEVSGTLSTKDGGPLIVDGLATFKTGVLINALAQTRSINASGDVIASGNIEAGMFKSTSGFEAAAGSRSSVANLSIAGELTQTDATSIVSFAAPTSINNSLSVSSDLSVGNNVTIGTRDNSSSIAGNHISTEGETGLIESKNVKAGYVNGGLTSSEVAIPDTILNSSGLQNLRTTLTTRRYIEMDNSIFKAAAIFANSAYFGDTIYVKEIRRLDEDSGGQDWIDITARDAYYAS